MEHLWRLCQNYLEKCVDVAIALAQPPPPAMRQEQCLRDGTPEWERRVASSWVGAHAHPPLPGFSTLICIQALYSHLCVLSLGIYHCSLDL